MSKRNGIDNERNQKQGLLQEQVKNSNPCLLLPCIRKKLQWKILQALTGYRW